jgi:hypothetical protein
MKFLCSNCKAKYQIADEKVAGRTLRMTCRRCQEEIVIRGEPVPIGASFAPQAPPASHLPVAPSPLGEGFHMQVASNVRSAITPVPALDEWHVAINDVPVGPIRREDLARKLAAGQIDSTSLAWREGMDDWAPIGQIPELAHLSTPPPPAAHAQPPPLIAQPGMRSELTPFGGRAGAMPYGAEPSWTGGEERPSQVVINPSIVDQMTLRRATPSLPAMFALFCVFAFLMSGMTILGARWLSERGETGSGTGQIAAAGAAAPAPAPPTMEVPADEQDPEPMVIAPDEAKNEGASSARPRAGATSAAKPKKALTAEQREMLARMGGDTTTDLSSLRPDDATGGAPRAARGSLSSEDVAKVVQRGRQNLQRCYETALRGSGSDETVRINVDLVVSPSGNATNVAINGGNLPGLQQCVARVIKMWRFPATGESSPVKFPVLFQPGA